MSTQPVILTALKEELAAVQAAVPSDKVRVIRAGIGWDAATRATQELLRSDCPPWICFSGFCGGLADDLAVGDVVISDSLLDAEHNRVNVDRAILASVTSALSKSAVKFRAGSIVCVRKPVISVEQKRELAKSSQAIAVDMESFAVAQAVAGKCPVFALRAVSDSANDALPPEVAGFLDEKGNVRMGKVTAYMLGGPRNIKTLMELKARSDNAVASLTATWKAVWPTLKDIS